MSINNFQPTVWAADILKATKTALVYGGPDVISSDYEGEIQASGDTVKINMLGDVTVGNYVKGVDMAAPQQLSDASLSLVIDQAKYFNFVIDDIDKRQASANLMDEATDRAGYAVASVADQFTSGMYTDIDPANWIGNDTTPITGFNVSSTKAYDQLVDLGTKLTNNDTPFQGRWVVIPPWYAGYLQKDARFTSFGTQANRQQLEQGIVAAENGYVGQAAGFNVYMSNNVPNVASAKYKIIAGHKFAWTFANQITETEAYRPERQFGDALKGLQVFGAKVIRPSNLAVLDATDA